ncbi:DNA phosphorothioation system sulfurtransferase DndC [Turicibacter sanguinis]|uniref:DNA phosphorothioation system sulfurtransferase DndC n=1 Tax=Turicibacter sanguinis TaxID=154288 RepID=UPI0018ABE868|nr:DNA phosphorothioation system sulfurtransferase DndC [Turicibacter sanguinis]MDB8556972.1 DNA phosphorothioation system sulfurtransferase DndC [Turicibacter sanguinis]MDB8559747.1 DNA phosphorothioation system sulfurtransferase DndC [Turicibacter sanguinis]
MDLKLDLNSLLGENDLIKNTKEKIKRVYKMDNKPWVIGYSGGKDSTVLTQLIFETLSEMNHEELHKQVYIISSDTLVETPIVIAKTITTLNLIERKAKDLKLPISTHLIRPEATKSFWSNLIGRGYPTPNQTFRWCTDRLKIEPANRFIMDKVSEFGEVIMVLGVRDGESNSRDRVLESHTVEGKELMSHTTLTNAYVFAPIRPFSTDDVWNYLLNHPSPWGGDNYELFKLYTDSNSNECPLIVDENIKQSAGSCGNSRFGCWTCTVVNEDKALTGFIENGEEWLRPLLQYRNWLYGIRDQRHMRMKRRMNGQMYFLELKVDKKGNIIIDKKGKRDKVSITRTNDTGMGSDGNEYQFMTIPQLKEYVKVNNIDLSSGEDPNIVAIMGQDDHGNDIYGILGTGPFTLEARQEMLMRLLLIQHDFRLPDGSQYELISVDELKEIRKYWLKEGDWLDSLPKIYNDILGNSIQWETDNKPLYSESDLRQLEQICNTTGTDYNLFMKLLMQEKKYRGFKIRKFVQQEIEKTMKQDFIHFS